MINSTIASTYKLTVITVYNKVILIIDLILKITITFCRKKRKFYAIKWLCQIKLA